MQTWSSNEISVCPSVKCMQCDKTEEKSVQIFITCERSFRLVFWEEKWWVGDDPFYRAFIGLTIHAKLLVGTSPSTWNLGSKWPHWSEIANFRSIFVCSTSAVRPSEKSSIKTNRKSTTCLPMSPRWTSHVVSTNNSSFFFFSPVRHSPGGCRRWGWMVSDLHSCLLYTSDAADE